MQAEDFQIGDWVKNRLCTSSPYGQITLDSFHCQWKDEMEQEDKKNCLFSYFEPIPLTADILKLNGINPESHCDLSMPRWTMGIRNKERNAHLEMTFRYVHELQQGLRLIGLKELADNFKVEG